ncbi:MAG: Rrf2 family transcriptional regulator [Candidatus Eisenbacteria bacterium]|nr:Rrf2 family transcriptional regulator [Candidatus Eisenbacteria bacterium]
MRLTRKGEYALRAMIVLAHEHGRGPTRIQDIAAAERIPKKFLEQILLELKKAGLIHSRRGAGGGYYLVRAPEEVTLAEVVRTIDGPLAPLSCVSMHAHVRCPEQDTCGLYSVMRDVRNAVADVMENVTLADACLRSAGARDGSGARARSGGKRARSSTRRKIAVTR